MTEGNVKLLKPDFLKSNSFAQSELAKIYKDQFDRLFGRLTSESHADSLETKIVALAHLLRLVFLYQQERC